MTEWPIEPASRWLELRRACEFLGLMPKDRTIESFVSDLSKENWRKVIDVAQRFIAIRAEERERCAKIAEEHFGHSGDACARLIVGEIRRSCE